MAVAALSDAAAQHRLRRRVWEAKYAIRACYRGWYDRLRPYIVPGESLEVGAGSGCFTGLWPGLIASDLVPTPFVRLVADGMRLPLADASLSNLLAVDLLHHLSDPHRFFEEASRVLRPGGRVLAIEPWISPFSRLVYGLMHHEDVWFGGYHREASKQDPWDGNMAIANLLFSVELPDWPRRHPRLRILHRRRFSLLDFQLAGGFKPYAFVARPWLYDACLWLDRRLDILAPLLGFRVMVVIERLPDPAG